VSPGGISLAEDRNGPFGIESGDGSVGRLSLPSGMALDEGLLLYIADREALRVLNFHPAAQTFEPIASLGGQGSERRQFLALDAIAIQGQRLSVADSLNERVQTFHLQTLALIAEWTPSNVPGGWVPTDLVQAANALYILDRRNHRVLKSVVWSDQVEVVIAGVDAGEEWLRMIADRAGLLYILVKKNGVASLQVWDVSNPTAPVDVYLEAGSVRNRFAVPPIQMDSHGRFQMPESLGAACGRSLPGNSVPPENVAPPAPAKPPGVKRFELDRVSYELDRELRELRVYTLHGQLRSLFGPRDKDGRPVDARDVTAWDPTDLRQEGECIYILDSANQQVWRHRFSSDFVSPALQRKPWEAPPFASATTSTADRWFNAQGEPVEAPDVTSSSNQRLYVRSGFWLSNAVPSEIHRCQWDRIRLTLAPPPPGVIVEVLTFAQDLPNFSLAEDDPRWDHAHKYVAPLEPLSDLPRQDVQVDFQIKSRPAENLSIQVRMSGDGYQTAAIKSLRVYYPRESYLQFLPKVYSSQDEMRRFLEGFLGALQVTADELDETILTIEKHFDPDAVPEGAPMRYLADWLALTLEGTWTTEQNRKLLSQVPKIYPHRGTPRGFRDFLRVYLANAAGLPVDDVATTEFPMVLEGFAERRALMLDTISGPLWGPAAVGRLQLGEFSTAGEVSLVSTGDPNLDYFEQYSHRFKVFAPAAWIRSADEESLIRRAIEAEKPAHTAYELVLVENRIQVGVQSTVGFDTVIGGPVDWRLPCAVGQRNHLNVDTVLGGTAECITVSAGELIVT